MALYYELSVYKDTYSLILLLYNVTGQYPREYKFSLGQDIKRDAMELIRSIYRANRASKKETYLLEFLEQFELLKLEIRISYDLHLLPLKTYTTISEIMTRIGKQINGWRKIKE